MQNPIFRNIKNANYIIRALLAAISILLVTLWIPKIGKFKYDFQLNKPWLHEDLLAPFSFPVEKTDSALEGEKREINNNFKPFYQRNTALEEQRKKDFISKLDEESLQSGGATPDQKDYMITQGTRLLTEIFDKGVIKLNDKDETRPGTFILTELKNNVGEDKQLMQYYSLDQARNIISQRAKEDTALDKTIFISSVLSAVDCNVIYDQNLSQKRLSELLQGVSTTKGLVTENEKIISRGNIVTPAKYQVLKSLKDEYELKLGQGKNWSSLFVGYIILVCIFFSLYFFCLQLFAKEIFTQNRSLLLVLMHLLFFVYITAYIVQNTGFLIWIIPYCIVPVVLLAFFGVRVAFFTYTLLILICGLIVPNSFEFIIIQFTAGVAALLSMVNIRYISQFFISAILILIVYIVGYLGISVIQSGVIEQLQWSDLGWFGGNFLLILLAYPLIYVFEKVFGFLSDISLLELSDINNKLLKELAGRAPGTFQHSLQVANLAEAVIDRIGGNSLLTRVGALYHDIGKMYNPDYFIENQKHESNPHDLLTDVESAEMIINHVPKGIETAQENNLPTRVIDFIRTHHGTTRVEYFYQNYKRKHIDENVDEVIFRYPGPKPSTKENAVLMIVDSVEAASRALKQPDEVQIDKLVDKVIDHKIEDNQFDYANITIQEINTSRRLLKKLLKSLYHIRISYPGEVEQKKKL